MAKLDGKGRPTGYYVLCDSYGMDRNPSLAYNSHKNEFLFTFQSDSYNTLSNGSNTVESRIYFGTMDASGQITTPNYDAANPERTLLYLVAPIDASQPNLAWSNDTNKYFFSTTWSWTGNIERVLGAFVTEDGVFFPAFVVASLVNEEGVLASSHHIQSKTPFRIDCQRFGIRKERIGWPSSKSTLMVSIRPKSSSLRSTKQKDLLDSTT